MARGAHGALGTEALAHRVGGEKHKPEKITGREGGVTLALGLEQAGASSRSRPVIFR